MKTSTLLLFALLSASLISCKHDKTEEYKQLILGDWRECREEPEYELTIDGDTIPLPPEYFDFRARGYSFEPKGVLHYKQGAFRFPEQQDIECISNTEYLGTKSEYLIENDSLKTLMLSNGKWKNARIVDIANDTLTLSFDNDSILRKFTRCKYENNDTLTFDRIVISSSGCYGYCPSNSIMICKNGNVVYNGICHNSINGLFSSGIDKELYSFIENNFKKASIKQLKNSYYANWTDDEEISVSFIKDNKIYKTIQDYGHQSPIEFQWAYNSTSYLYQHLKLDTLPTPIDLSQVTRMIAFHDTDNKSLILKDSESFYLKNLLFEAEVYKKEFISLYSMTTFFNQLPIVTDGQYYKISLKDGSTITLDIGHNFILGNNLQDKFEKIEKYSD